MQSRVAMASSVNLFSCMQIGKGHVSVVMAFNVVNEQFPRAFGEYGGERHRPLKKHCEH